MFSPDKKKIVSRSIISVLLLIPMFIIVPLSFAIGILISVLIFIAGVTIFGVRIVCELITDGIPEMDEEGNWLLINREGHKLAKVFIGGKVIA